MNVFQTRKGIHVDLDSETHLALRTKLFPLGLSMQQVFEEFARRFINDDSKATRIVEALIERRVRDVITDNVPHRVPTKVISPSELDDDVLYKMIDEGIDTDETDR